MRCLKLGMYYAIEFDSADRNYMAVKQTLLKNNSVSGDWEDKENFHITVIYVGKDADGRQEYMEALDLLKERFNPQPFNVQLQNFNSFPGDGEGQTLWLGVKNSLPLYELRNNLLTVLKDTNTKIAPPRFKGYTPHITMGYNVTVNDGFDTKFEDDKLIPIKSICLWDSFKANDTYITNKIYELKF